LFAQVIALNDKLGKEEPCRVRAHWLLYSSEPLRHVEYQVRLTFRYRVLPTRTYSAFLAGAFPRPCGSLHDSHGCTEA
jgi:hypothetical protein